MYGRDASRVLVSAFGDSNSSDGGLDGGGVLVLLVIGACVWYWFRNRDRTPPIDFAQVARDAAVGEFRRELDADGVVLRCIATVLVPRPPVDGSPESWDFRVLALGRGQLICSVGGVGYESILLGNIEHVRFESNVLEVRTMSRMTRRYRAGPPAAGAVQLAEFVRALRQVRERQPGIPERGVAEELVALYELVERGALDADDWMLAKRHFFGQPESAVETAARHLNDLYDLFLRGGLTQGEWQMKKGDILSRR